MKIPRRLRGPLVAVAALMLIMPACSSDNEESSGTVTLTVGNLPTAERAEDRKNFLRLVDEFQQANPDIKLDPVEIEWSKETFNAQLAGGTLPMVISVPYTEPQALIARKQVADITVEFDAVPELGHINKQILKVAQDSGGKIYGVPTEGYTIALIYNRDLFTKAGLNPDSPPRTWDEAREAARAITTKTGAAGYAQMTAGGFGGWMFSALLYSFGGTVETASGDAYKASFNGRPAKDTLSWLKTLRWDDKAMGSTFLYDQETLRKDFAAGKVGMYLDGADSYQSITTNFKLDPKHFGVSTLPQQGGMHGTLGGGSVTVVRPGVTAAERAAAVKWIKFLRLNRLFDQASAAAYAKARADDGLPVGAPEFPLVDREQFQKYQEWIKPHVNTPQQNFTPYVSSVDTVPVLPEPPSKAQDVYNAFSSVVQAVLTRQNADIDKLLGDAESQINRLLAMP